MVRTQIQLTEKQAERLKSVASRKGISMAEVIRQAVDAVVSQRDERTPEQLYQRALGIAGKFRSDAQDISNRHDDYLVDTYRR